MTRICLCVTVAAPDVAAPPASPAPPATPWALPGARPPQAAPAAADPATPGPPLRAGAAPPRPTGPPPRRRGTDAEPPASALPPAATSAATQEHPYQPPLQGPGCQLPHARSAAPGDWRGERYQSRRVASPTTSDTPITRRFVSPSSASWPLICGSLITGPVSGPQTQSSAISRSGLRATVRLVWPRLLPPDMGLCGH